MIYKTYLPRTIKDKGTTFELVTGASPRRIRDLAKQCNIKFRTVFVLARNLRGRNNLHDNPYQPSEWVFVQDRSKFKLPESTQPELFPPEVKQLVL